MVVAAGKDRERENCEKRSKYNEHIYKKTPLQII